MTKNNKERKKRIWQAVLAAGIILELVLINLYVVARLNGVDLPQWQMYVFIGIAVWVYIAFLKQRSIEISKSVVDEKLKTHALADYLREGILVLDGEGNIMLVNRRAAGVLGIDELDMLGRSLAEMVAEDERDLLRSGRNGEAVLRFLPGDRSVHFSIVVLTENSEGESRSIVYVRKAKDLSEEADEGGELDAGGRRVVDGAVVQLREWVGRQDQGSNELRVVEAALYVLEAQQVLRRLESSGGHVKGTSYKVSEVVGGVMEQLKRAVEQLGTEVDTMLNAEEFALHGDADSVSALFMLLIGSGLSAAGTRGTLKIQSAAMGAHVGIAVTDSGNLMEAERDLLFEAGRGFVPSEGGLRGSLYEARRVVEKSGGTLTADLQPEGGLRVTVMLPGNMS
jgi:PAS domain-containing protein